MSAERHARVKDLFHRALDLEPGARDEFLRGCGADADVQREVVEMLAVAADTTPFLQPRPAPSLASAIPDRLGPFRVLRRIGAGGMGEVYEAEQERPRRRVALKVLHPGSSTETMLRRFELEAEVLGRLQHTGIARIYEAGTDDRGHGPQPWLAMELIDGVPLTDFCRAHDLPLERRLVLIAKVSDAVQHAHQRGIVHRDLKPANVLVETSGEPKVLDFGIARAIDADLQSVTLRTNPGTVIGTLQYMSPEQAAADPDAIDVRADVYSLGAMLYELIAGRPPLDLARLPMHEALRRVLVLEPTPLRTAAARVPVDVAVIAHKALAKDKQQRYGSAAELAADLRRFLRREPISAQPPSRWYRVRRFAARNRAVVAGLATAFAALVMGLSLALWQRDQAREALARVEGINRFLLSDLLMSPSPERLGPEVRVVDVLAPAARSAERTFAHQPRVAAEVLDAVGSSYRALGMVVEAEAVTRHALDLLGDAASDRLGLRVQSHMVATLTDLTRADEAVALGEAVVATSERRLGADDPDTLAHRYDLALARWTAGQPDRSVAELRAVAAQQARVLGTADPTTLTTRSQLAAYLAASGTGGAIDEARTLLTSTLATQEQVLGAEHPAALGSRSRLAWILTLGSAWQEAEAAYAKLRPALDAVYGPDHPYAALACIDMAQCPLHLERVDEAETLVRGAVQALERRLGPEHAWSLDAHLMMASVLSRKGEHAAAIAEAKRVVDLRQRRGVADEGLGHAQLKLGRCYQSAGELSEAITAFGAAAEVYRRVFKAPTDYLAQALYNLGVATRDAGDARAAIAPLREALEIDIGHWSSEHTNVASDRYNLAKTLMSADQPRAAVAELRAALATGQRLQFDPDRLRNYRAALGRALLLSGEKQEAEQHLRQAWLEFEQAGRTDAPWAQRARDDLAQLEQKRSTPPGEK